MGYYTRYKLRVLPRRSVKDESAVLQAVRAADDIDTINKIISDAHADDEYIIAELRKDKNIQYIFDKYGDIQNSCTWYEWEDDMKKFSRRFPRALFILDGEGEESGDLWRAYIMNGECIMDEAKLVFSISEADAINQFNTASKK